MKLNVDRMRRHVARSTPDTISRKFDYLSDNYMYEYEAWVKNFAKRMEVKYSSNKNPSKCKIEIELANDFDNMNNKIVILRAIPYTNLRITHRKD